MRNRLTWQTIQDNKIAATPNNYTINGTVDVEKYIIEPVDVGGVKVFKLTVPRVCVEVLYLRGQHFNCTTSQEAIDHAQDFDEQVSLVLKMRQERNVNRNKVRLEQIVTRTYAAIDALLNAEDEQERQSIIAGLGSPSLKLNPNYSGPLWNASLKTPKKTAAIMRLFSLVVHFRP